MSTSSLLQVQGLQAGYAVSQVLFGLDFELAQGQVITLLGRNGMGKSTTVKCLSGLLKPTAGKIILHGQDLANRPAYMIGRAGMGLVPEGRQVFPTLSVKENLVATANMRNVAHHERSKAWTLERVYALFPRLQERAAQLAGQLSGGEQQMLAVGRALMTNPKILILDEATEGLAPLIRAEIWKCLALLKEERMAMIVVDKNIKPLLPLADRHYVIEKGRIAWQGNSDELVQSSAEVQKYLSV
jgi:branched-chain amino acid transport system ATP-binding protein